MFLMKTIQLALKRHRPLVQYGDRTPASQNPKMPQQCKTHRGFLLAARLTPQILDLCEGRQRGVDHGPLSPLLLNQTASFKLPTPALP
jgi:hypothetical protein